MPVMIKEGLTRLVKTRRLLPLFKYHDEVHNVPASQPAAKPMSEEAAQALENEERWCDRLAPTVRFQALPAARSLFSI